MDAYSGQTKGRACLKKIALLIPIVLLLTGCTVSRAPKTSDQAFANTTSSAVQSCLDAITWDQAFGHIGELVTITGPTISTVYASESRGQPTFLNIGRTYPDPGRFTVVIWGYNRDSFPFAPEVGYHDKTICVTGLVETYKGIPQIVADRASDIEIVE